MSYEPNYQGGYAEQPGYGQAPSYGYPPATTYRPPAPPRRDNAGTIVWHLTLAAIVIFFPLVGHVILTVMILTDRLTVLQKVLWLAVVWFAWFIGPLLYLLFGQQRNRLIPGLHD